MHAVLTTVPGMGSPSPSAGSPAITIAPATVPSLISLDVVVSAPLPPPSVESAKALLIGSPVVLAFHLDATEDDPFVHEVPSTSTLGVVTAPSARTAAIAKTTRREPGREPSEATIPLEANKRSDEDCQGNNRNLRGTVLMRET